MISFSWFLVLNHTISQIVWFNTKNQLKEIKATRQMKPMKAGMVPGIQRR